MKENRMKAWRQSQAQSGKKRLDVHVDHEVIETLKSIRSDTGESYGDIIGKLVRSAA